MDNFNEEREYWKKLYEKGEIDEDTFIRNIDTINMRNNFDNTTNYTNSKYYSNTNNFNKQLPISKVICVLSIILCIFFIYKANVNKEYTPVTDLGMLSDPEQEYTSGSVIKIVDNQEVNIDYVASYNISGRVVKTYSYAQYGISNKLSPIDVGLTWGDLAKDENNIKVIWGNSGNRFLTWTIYDTDWYNSYGAMNFQKHVSNNHLIASNDDISKKINAITEGEYIHLTGYLVNMTYELENGAKYSWNTSTSRTDSGDGACEIMYVTDIEWLREATR
jgi:hypothetical protein